MGSESQDPWGAGCWKQALVISPALWEIRQGQMCSLERTGALEPNVTGLRCKSACCVSETFGKSVNILSLHFSSHNIGIAKPAYQGYCKIKDFTHSPSHGGCFRTLHITITLQREIWLLISHTPIPKKNMAEMTDSYSQRLAKMFSATFRPINKPCVKSWISWVLFPNRRAIW